MVFASRYRTHRTSVGWGGSSRGQESEKSCCLFREKQSEDRFSEKIQWTEWLMYWWERGIEETETKIWETDIFSPMSNLKTKSKVFIPSQKFFFCSSEYLQVTFHQVHSTPTIQSFSVLRSIFVSSRKKKSSFCWCPCDFTRCPPCSSEAIMVTS